MLVSEPPVIIIPVGSERLVAIVTSLDMAWLKRRLPDYWERASSERCARIAMISSDAAWR